MEQLRELLGKGADELNLVMFGTSGVHGSYATIEDVEASLRKYGTGASFQEDEEPDDFSPWLTVLVLRPRLVSLAYTGRLEPTLEDIPQLKLWRDQSIAAFARIGMPEAGSAG